MLGQWGRVLLDKKAGGLTTRGRNGGGTMKIKKKVKADKVWGAGRGELGKGTLCRRGKGGVLVRKKQIKTISEPRRKIPQVKGPGWKW